MAILKTILIILLVYYLLKILARMFAPKIFSYAAKKTEEHFKERFEGFADAHRNQEEHIDGDVIIDKNTTQKRKESKKVGEYIDFEEIDE